jgi:integrase
MIYGIRSLLYSLSREKGLVYVKDQLGHSSIKITVDTYGHLVPGGNRQAVDKLDERITVREENEAMA